MANPHIVQQLDALTAALEQTGPGALYAVALVLRNSYLAGRHNEFAKHCCTFSQAEGATFSAGAPEAMKGAKPPRETLH